MRYLIILISVLVLSCKKQAETTPTTINVTVSKFTYTNQESNTTYWGFKFQADTAITLNGYIKFNWFCNAPYAEYFGSMKLDFQKQNPSYYYSQIPVGQNQTFSSINPYTEIFQTGYIVNFK